MWNSHSEELSSLADGLLPFKPPCLGRILVAFVIPPIAHILAIGDFDFRVGLIVVVDEVFPDHRVIRTM